MVNAQEWLQNNYPNKEIVIKIKRNHLSERIEGELVIENFPNLQKINVSSFRKGKLTKLKIINCPQLRKLNCENNQLEKLDIDEISHRHLQKVNCKNNELRFELNPFPNRDLIDKYGQCQKCFRNNTSYNWCQPCAEQEWQEDIKNLTGQEVVKKFIEQQKERKEYERLAWIPYEEFTNVEYLAEGGFGKVYKAKWKWKDGDDRMVALKSLTESQNITLDFLTEIANTKLVDGEVGIVRCYGISQDSNTKNYVMVMEYKEGDNHRNYLKNNNSKLTLGDKIHGLFSLANALRIIHKQNLIHGDFHSGNILNDPWIERGEKLFSGYITDLGFSRPVSFQREEGKIFGIPPYIAPEVLQGKSYTQASDIYSFGIIAYELLANAYPYTEMDNLDLALRVCNKEKPLRPNIDSLQIPQLLKDLIKKCWNDNPKERPNSTNLTYDLYHWNQGNDIEFTQQVKEKEEKYNTFSQNTPYQIHSTAIIASKPINTKEITESLKTKECQDSGILELTLDKLNLQEDQSENALQAQIEVPLKENN
ncbi:Putative Serine/Threonine protein kinases [endosymbiont DhMRE of Dentiscutata heterogama]|uniref:protein kinase n=1 Tax=endosymbiont DhMRE of Dentiscutata heterogama TaxID=1609546 RepID=UPI000631FFA4|nr:protein kinase [endosymbiont DhMRE of Dentiscutata heterogama]CFW92707.1 Putative Serine/Threonine protein kinases [endosymbiont DhMRE of Dentiscutata heterogama]